MKYKIIIKILSLITATVSAAMLLPWLCAVRSGTDDAKAFVLASAICAALSAAAFSWSKNAPYSDLGVRESYACVTFSWIAASVAGALPFLFSGVCTTFTDAFFETMSGFTTTGSSIFTQVEHLPKGILLWRALTQWLGGMGIVVLVLAITSIAGGGSNGLFKAESPGPVLQKTDPTIDKMSKKLWNIYIGITLLSILLLLAGGMPLFDSVCHSFSAVSTGGFSIKNDGIGFYNSAYIEYALTFIMFICGISFSLHLAALAKRSLRPYRDAECLFYIKIVLSATAAIAFFLVTSGRFGNIPEAVRNAAFNVVSIITTTGFANAEDFSLWHKFAVVLLFALMFIGGCAGSTAGGIKCVRINAAWQTAKTESRKLIHPNAIIPIQMGKQPVDGQFAASAATFIVLYIFVYIISTLLLCACGCELTTSASAIAAALGNIGPGLGEIGPKGSFSHLCCFAKWVCSFCMLAGRLELYTVFVLLCKDEWVR